MQHCRKKARQERRYEIRRGMSVYYAVRMVQQERGPLRFWEIQKKVNAWGFWNTGASSAWREKKGFQKKRLHPEEAGVRMKLQATHYKDANLMILCIIGDAMMIL